MIDIELEDEHSGRDFALGFFLGTMFIFTLPTIAYFVKNSIKTFNDTTFYISTPIVLFIVVIIFCISSFKAKKENIAYGIIFSVFLIPIILLMVFLFISLS